MTHESMKERFMIAVKVDTNEQLSFFITKTKRLIPRERKVLQMLLFDNLTLECVAKHFNVSTAAIYYAKKRAQQKVKDTYILWLKNSELSGEQSNEVA